MGGGISLFNLGKKMKKQISLILYLVLGSAFADQQQDDLNAKRMAWTKAYMEGKGLPIPDGGIKVVPLKEMRSYEEKKEQRMKVKMDIERLGYIKEDAPSTTTLLNIKITAPRDLKHYANDFSPTNTHLKPAPSQLRMAYTPTEIPSSVAHEYFGAAPYLTYLKDQGWVGVIQFFSNNDIGNCSFSENNIKLSHGSVILAKEDVRYDVNGKETLVHVIGTPESGFTYSVEWFDATFFRKVECANKTFSKDFTNVVINIAKSIDNS